MGPGGLENPAAYQAFMANVHNLEIWAVALTSGAIFGAISLSISSFIHRNDPPKENRRVKGMALGRYKYTSPNRNKRV